MSTLKKCGGQGNLKFNFENFEFLQTFDDILKIIINYLKTN